MAGTSVQWSKVISDRLKDSNHLFSAEHRTWLQTSNVDDASQMLKKVEAEHANSSTSLKALQKVRPAIDTFNMFADFAASLASLDAHGIAGLVVGSLKITVSLASSYMEAFEAISDHIDEIHEAFQILVKHEYRFRDNPSEGVNRALYRVFSSYWAFFEDVYKLLYSAKRGKSRNFLSHVKDAFKGAIARIKGQAESIHKFCDMAYREIDLATATRRDEENSQVQRQLQEIEYQMTKDQLRIFHEQRRLFMSQLAPVSVEDNLKNQLRVRAPGTWDWIFQDPSFNTWEYGNVDGKSNSILWLSAGPGFGKSSLTAFLTDNMRLRYTTGIAYFAFDSNETRRNVRTLLRTLVHQVFRKDELMGEPHIELKPSMLSNSRLRASNRFQDGLEPDMSLLEIMDQIIDEQQARKETKITMFIIDALDECPQNDETEEEIELLFKFLARLPTNWKILFTSRLNPWFAHHLPPSLGQKIDHRTLTKQNNDQDIRAYVVYALDQIMADKVCKWSSAFRDEVEHTIMEKSEGMFKWTSVVVKRLSSKTMMARMSAAQKALNEVPPDIQDLYKQALLRLLEVDDEYTKELSIRALKWILRSYRPLKIKELEIGLGIEPGTTGVGESARIPGLRELLEEHIGDLITVAPDTGTIRMTHTSAREFLTSSPRFMLPDGSPVVPENLGDIDLDMLQVCITYLNDPYRPFLDGAEAVPETVQRFDHIIQTSDFWEYACIGLVHHLVEVCESGALTEEVEADIETFFRADESMAFLKWMQLFTYFQRKNYNGANEAYISVLDVLLDSGPAVSRPFSKFMKDKYPDITKHLGFGDGDRFIRWQAFLAHPLGKLPPCYGATLLASFFNFRDSLETLIQSGENLHFRGRGRRPSAIYWAASGDSTDTLELLLSEQYKDNFPFRRRAPEGRNGPSSPLAEAIWLPTNIYSRPGSYPAATMLLDHGSKISWGFEELLLDFLPDSEGALELTNKVLEIPGAFTFRGASVGHVISYAAFCGQSHILSAFANNKDLLDHIFRNNADDDIKGDHQNDPRFHLAWIAACDIWQGMSALHLAASNNDAGVVQLLSSEDYDFDTVSYFNKWKPLHFAAQRGLEIQKHGRERHENAWSTATQSLAPEQHVVHTLSKVPGNVSAIDRAGCMPIHLAAYRGCEETISALSTLPYERDKTNRAGKTPLAIALELGHIPAAKILLQNGADLSKVPESLRDRFAFENNGGTGVINIQRAKPKWLFYSSCMRRAAKKPVPLPIIAWILTLAQIHETAEVNRDDMYAYNELMTELPYLQGPPVIQSSNRNPIHRITLTTLSSRQPFPEHTPGGNWSRIRSDKIDSKTGRLVPWLERPVFAWNDIEPKERSVQYSIDNLKDKPHLQALRPGDRICIVPLATYPAWEVRIQEARIKMEMCAIRDAFSNQDRRRIWARPKRLVHPKLRDRFVNLFEGKQRLSSIPWQRGADDRSVGVATLAKR
ncbi:hypothetical protein BDV96DRAFT_113827 [Lophiotrema nucula]|uniref:Uncharacterized protein n=1 Tax=Lophiotrema nucula TaxID=690887 RepID=A0A6A5Z290_9PLEO|nr:hypothetical protein BDV96DRAFT_113827 [Lophiotrema nucula]